MIIGLLVILKAGGTYVPLDPNYPDERLDFMVVDTGISLILTQRHLERRWQRTDVQVLVLDSDHSVCRHEQDYNLNQCQSSESSAYVIYTSGSTGTPKGVEILHRGIVRLVCGADYVQLDATQSVLQLAVLSFDASTFEIWGPLLHGGRCVLAPVSFPEPEELQQLLRQKNVRTLWLTSSLFNTLVDGHVAVLDGVEQLLVGGEALSVSHIRRAQQALGNSTQIINGYGPTESTTFACCYRLPALIPEDFQSIPIGRPISNTTAYVLDSNREPVPIGVTGELYLGGDGLARGYLNRPELTAEKFLHDPFSDRPDARMYRTGDLVRWRADGTLEFLGRRDQQICQASSRVTARRPPGR
jgi:amino acid adenylation domain-containing protein